MEHPLDGCIAKVERAGEHWEALSNAVTTYFDRPEDGILAYVTEGEYARETEEYISALGSSGRCPFNGAF